MIQPGDEEKRLLEFIAGCSNASAYCSLMVMFARWDEWDKVAENAGKAIEWLFRAEEEANWTQEFRRRQDDIVMRVRARKEEPHV